MSYIFKLNRKENKVSLRHTRNVFKLKHVGRQGLKGDNGKDGVVQKVIAGQNVSVDDSDPANPIISSIGDLGTRWGGITGNINDQTDLQSVIDNKADKTSLDALNVELHMIEDELYQDIQQGDSATLSSANLYTDTKILSINKGSIGLGNVDNTADLDKPVSTAQAAALALKADFPTSNSNIPVRNAGGAQSSIVYSATAVNSSIALRSATGTLSVTDATAGVHATTLQQMQAADALKVNKAGDTMTGTLAINASLPIELSNGSTTTRIAGGGGDLTVTATNAGQWRLRRTATGLWVGNNSSAITPQQMLHVDGNARINGVDYLVGTGFPNGVVSAPVGSIYIDSNVTNGASSWIKKSGTGNTGWQVLEGDTGWRNVTSLINTTDFSSTGLMVRRNGNIVSWANTVTALTAGSANSIFSAATIVASLIGFTASETFPGRKTFLNGAWPGTSVTQGRKGPGRASVGWPVTTTIGAVIDMQSDYICIDTWPTALPGTAA